MPKKKTDEDRIREIKAELAKQETRYRKSDIILRPSIKWKMDDLRRKLRAAKESAEHVAEYKPLRLDQKRAKKKKRKKG